MVIGSILRVYGGRLKFDGTCNQKTKQADSPNREITEGMISSDCPIQARPFFLVSGYSALIFLQGQAIDGGHHTSDIEAQQYF